MGTENLDNIIFGIHPVLEALRSGKRLERLYVSRGRKGDAMAEILRMAKSQGVDVQFEPWERLRSYVGREASHQGVVGIIAAYLYVAFEDIVSKTHNHNEPPFLLLLDHIQDPHNLGAILRSAECAGVQGVIITKDKSVGVTPTVIKVSAGATEYIPVCQVTNLVSAIEELKKTGIWVVGTSSVAQRRYDTVNFTMPIAIVIGNEEKGIRRLVTERCDLLVFIPLSGKIASLNVSVASAIVMFEVQRQRNIPV